MCVDRGGKETVGEVRFDPPARAHTSGADRADQNRAGNDGTTRRVEQQSSFRESEPSEVHPRPVVAT